MTVTLAAPKLPLVLPPGEAHAGDVVIADIGIPYEVIDGARRPAHRAADARAGARASITPRAADSHKGDFGRVTVIAGSRGKTGAAHLAAMGALRSGAGLVTVATPASCLPIVASMAPEFMTEPLPETGEGSVAAAALDRRARPRRRTSMVCGPGLGRTGGRARIRAGAGRPGDGAARARCRRDHRLRGRSRQPGRDAKSAT